MSMSWGSAINGRISRTRDLRRPREEFGGNGNYGREIQKIGAVSLQALRLRAPWSCCLACLQPGSMAFVVWPRTINGRPLTTIHLDALDGTGRPLPSSCHAHVTFGAQFFTRVKCVPV